MFWSIIMLSVLAWGGQAWAQETNESPILTHRIDISMAGGFTLESDPKASGLEHRIDYGIVWRLPAKTGFLTKVGVGTGSTKFKPAFRLVVGPGWKLSDRWGIGLGVLYKLCPGWGDDNMSHVLALSIAPSLKISDTVTFGLGIGAGPKIINDGKVVGWSMSFFPSLSFRFK